VIKNAERKRILVWVRTRKGHGESLSILPELPLASQMVVDWHVRTNSSFSIPRAILWLSIREVDTIR
jgi:hypothetical protein